MPAATSPADDLQLEQQFQAQLTAEIAAATASLRRIATSLGEIDGGPVDAIEALMAGGKRMRARLCFWSWQGHRARAISGTRADTDTVPVLAAASAIEFFQAAALLHDDIIDRSATRRGKPAAHKAFASSHRTMGMVGDDAHFGVGAAILAGDLALIQANDLAAHAGQLAGVAPAFNAAWHRMGVGVTLGQYLDLASEAAPAWGQDPAHDEQRAWEVIVAKTAQYSVEYPLRFGAILAGASEEELDEMSRVGIPLGEAFQLRDDVLGVFGDPKVTGKPAGDDIRENKRTVLLARTMAALRTADQERLGALVNSGSYADSDVEWVTEMMVTSGAIDQVEGIINHKYAQATAALAESSLSRRAQETLRHLADQTVRRDR
ncbi:polyprenyl synthetase family protein [Rarobacter incanus]|uniref:Geranylgeranyl diphosphate synthase type I n=1 Tax=Rarobacter incanus TaxID=153494 RepID=A0A542SMD9_9MICO|nr:polyprenyl synthetase family protein [Rarobacter incanus]TQK75793.1 geranylgeranyl diphosphate synthase type I [Rarobacter incanus]